MKTFFKALRPASALALCVFMTGCISVALPGSGRNRGQVTPEIIQEADHFWTRDEVLVIPLTGIVSVGDAHGLLGGETGMLVSLKDRLKAAEKDRFLKAVILKIDSPGGGVTASDLIYHEIVEFKKKTGLPVIAMMNGTAASGGFYIAMAADEIYALPTTVTGSIGVIITLPGLQGLSQKIGFEMRVIKSGIHKDGGSPWLALDPSDREIFQSMIDDSYQRFLSVILEGRGDKGLTREALLPIADGRVMTAQTALDNHLIDGIIYPDEVIEKAKTLAGLSDAMVVTYEYRYNYRGNIYARQPESAPKMREGGGDLNLINFDLNSLTDSFHGAKFMYMWAP